MTSRRDFILTGSSALAGMGASTQVQAASPSSRPPEDGTSIIDHGAHPDRPDNKEAIERAVDAARAGSRTVIIPPGTFRFSTIDLRENDGTDPRRFVIAGPGTLRSEYRGAAITALAGQFYDLIIDGPAFESTPGKGTVLINGDHFRRLIFAPGTQIRNFDWVVRAEDYLQSIRVIGAIIRGGAGAVVRAPLAFDCIFSHNIIEFVTDGFVIDGANDPALNRCSIDSNVIEGIGGRAIVLGACLATSVSNNYLEGNSGGDIRLDAGTAPHKGLRVQGNAIQLPPKALAEGRFAITWGRSTALPARAGGNFCNGNLHDTAGTSAIIAMEGDFAAGELYRGYDRRSARNRPVGRSSFSDGLTQHFTWFDRAITINPYQSEIGFTGKFSGSAGPQVLTFGTRSPQQAADAFDRKEWTQGSIIFNAAPERGGVAVWVCLQSGTPGVWAPVRLDG